MSLPLPYPATMRPVHHLVRAIAMAEVPVTGDAARMAPVTVVAVEGAHDRPYRLTVETNDGLRTRLGGLAPEKVVPLTPQTHSKP